MPHERSAPDTPSAWLEHAASDLAIAKSHIEDAYLEDLCYHSQQCIEKSFKAVLPRKKGIFPYMHDLAALVSLLQETEIVLPDTFRKDVRLTRFAVQARYPGIDEPVSVEQWRSSTEVAESILLRAREVLAS